MDTSVGVLQVNRPLLIPSGSGRGGWSLSARGHSRWDFASEVNWGGLEWSQTLTQGSSIPFSSRPAVAATRTVHPGSLFLGKCPGVSGPPWVGPLQLSWTFLLCPGPGGDWLLMSQDGCLGTLALHEEFRWVPGIKECRGWSPEVGSGVYFKLLAPAPKVAEDSPPSPNAFLCCTGAGLVARSISPFGGCLMALDLP